MRMRRIVAIMRNMSEARAVLTSIAALGVVFSASIATAQDAAVSAAPDPEFARVSQMLSGSWTTEASDPDTGETTAFWMHVAPITVQGLDQSLYVEQSRGAHMGRPFRQTIFSLYRFEGHLRLRTYEFHDPKASGYLTGMWATPDLMPATVKVEELYPRMDIELTATAGGYSGASPFPYPTSLSGAAQMTSELTVGATDLTTLDQGTASDGSKAWGERLTWRKSEPNVVVDRRGDGLVMIDLMAGEGPEAQDGNVLFLHYSLWSSEGKFIERSADRGQLYRVTLPFTGMKGWAESMPGLRKGSFRVVIIPPDLGFGDTQVGPIPPSSTLIFTVEVHEIETEKPDDQAAPGPQLQPQPNATGGGDAGAGAGAGGGGGHE